MHYALLFCLSALTNRVGSSKDRTAQWVKIRFLTTLIYSIPLKFPKVSISFGRPFVFENKW